MMYRNQYYDDFFNLDIFATKTVSPPDPTPSTIIDKMIGAGAKVRLIQVYMNFTNPARRK